MEDLFEGPARRFSGNVSIAHGGAPSAQAPLGLDPSPLRHLSGYAPFVSFLASLGLDPRTTARDPLALVRLLRDHHRDILERPELADAAAVFLGNTLAAARADAVWQGPDAVAGPRTTIIPSAIVGRVGTAPPERLQELEALLEVWRTAVYAEPLEVPDPTPPAPAVPYVRPSIEGLGVVPALGAVARGLVAHLRRNYALAWSEGLPEDTLLPAGAEWAVRLVPASADAAPLTLAAYPNALMVEAGALYMPSFPRRNGLEADLHALEQTTLAVVEGRFAERFPGPEPDWYEHALAFPDGSQRGSGAGLQGALGAEALDAARERLAALPNGWQPWPLRA